MKTWVLVPLLSAAASAAATRGRPFFGGPMSKKPSGDYSVESPWGGAVQEGNGWMTVTGKTVIPSVTGQDSSAGAAAWVGIDGYNCQSAILQTGVVAWGDGTVQSWYEWWPEAPVYYGDQLAVKAGDTIQMSVNATSTNSGTSTLENLTTGQSVTTPYENMSESLCLSDAEWIIEFGGGAQTFADFGRWTISNTGASGQSGQVTADGGNIVNVVINGEQQTNCGTQGGSMTCQWQP